MTKKENSGIKSIKIDGEFLKNIVYFGGQQKA